MSKKDKRFEMVLKEGNGILGYTHIFRDKQTGVHYLYHGVGYGGGLTPLLDWECKPIADMQ